VTGILPEGKVEAGSMHIYQPNAAEEPQWVFTSDVKLLYQPENEKE
jgi:hypothetical protein